MAGEDADDAENRADDKTVSPTVPQKRILPARERRASAAKRQASSPVSAPKSVSTPKKSTAAKPPSKPASVKYNKRKPPAEVTPTQRLSTPIAEKEFPTKVSDSVPLPTSHQRQSSKLSTSEYQSVSDSAVLVASLHRSRIRWLAEGVFEKYWRKPSKKKGTEGLANNPDLKSMQRLGSSTITIGPHTFDATIYTVRDNLPYRHPNQYPPPPVAPQPGFQNYRPPGPQVVKPHAPSLDHHAAQTAQGEVKQEKALSGSTSSPAPVRKVSGQSQPQTSASPGSQPATAQSGPDPVIRMLATRAATNPDLKALMKVVASSKASQEQLRLFQSHIDDLNVTIRDREQQGSEQSLPESENKCLEEAVSKPAQLDGTNTDRSQPVYLPPNGKQPGSLPSTHLAGAGHLTAPSSKDHPTGKVDPARSPLAAPSYARYPAPQQKLAIPEPRIKTIVLEFNTAVSSTVPASQDRYLFPEYAVLDTPLSGQGLEMVCSFFVVRKGSDLLAPRSIEGTAAVSPIGGLTPWSADEEYYQPVTMTIKTSQHRILETIARAAKPLEEVQNKLKEIMGSKTRVKDEWLVMRLPREKSVIVEGRSGGNGAFVDSAVEIEDAGSSGDEDDELKAFYGI